MLDVAAIVLNVKIYVPVFSMMIFYSIISISKEKNGTSVMEANGIIK